MRLQMMQGTDEVAHGGIRYLVNNYTWQVEVPDDVGRFMLDDGRSGARLIEEPEPGEITCPCCGFSWKPNCEGD